MNADGCQIIQSNMRHRRTAYELSASQVTTPEKVISLFWQLAHQRRSTLSNVLDLGAGDCRFGASGNFKRYTGIEIDKGRARNATLPASGTLIRGCAFAHMPIGYDACIGNPPYVRHHEIENPWKDQTVNRLEEEMGVRLNKRCNLYIYFLCLGLLKTHRRGLVAMIIPYEWISRPSAKGVRDFISTNGWSVAVYRFQSEIFPGVLTTASITIIDKSKIDSTWTYYDITPELKIRDRQRMTRSKRGVLEYSPRGSIWALRGLSPGSQKIFTLTEGERIHLGLSKKDVVPCVTRMRHLPRSVRELSPQAFKRFYIDAGQKCWLIKSYAKVISKNLQGYLDSVPQSDQNNYTCARQHPWYNFRPHPTPRLLVSSGFTNFGPKVLINSIGAKAVGTVLGIHSKADLPVYRLQQFITSQDLEGRVVAHAGSLKKIEVRQVNSVLNEFSQ